MFNSDGFTKNRTETILTLTDVATGWTMGDGFKLTISRHPGCLHLMRVMGFTVMDMLVKLSRMVSMIRKNECTAIKLILLI